MNKILFIVLLSLALPACHKSAPPAPPQPMGGSDEVGNGGNPALSLWFQRAQRKAPEMLWNLSPEKLAAAGTPEEADWWITHASDVARDLNASRVRWTKKPQDRCGHTLVGDTSDPPVDLYFPQCEKSVLSLEAAAQVLVHESIHHLGIADEERVNRLVTALFLSHGYRILQDQSGILVSELEGDLICEKKKPQPGDYRVVVEMFNGATRVRLYEEGNPRHFLTRLNCRETGNAAYSCRNPKAASYSVELDYIAIARFYVALVEKDDGTYDFLDCHY